MPSQDAYVFSVAEWVPSDEWTSAPDPTRLRYLRRSAELIEQRKRLEIARGVGVNSAPLAPVQPRKGKYAGATGKPLDPFYSESRVVTRLRTSIGPSKGTVTLWWDGGWGRIVGYHARGEVRGAPARNIIGLAKSGLTWVKASARRFWRALRGQRGPVRLPRVMERKRPRGPVIRPPRPSREPLAAFVKPKPKPGKFQSANDAIEWGKKAYPDMIFDVADIPTPQLNQIIVEFDRLAKKYPSVLGKLRYIGTAQPGQAPKEYETDWSSPDYAHAIAIGSLHKQTHIALNPRHWTSPEKLEALKETMQYGQRINWYSQGKGDIEDTFAHEFGHILDGYLLYNKGDEWEEIQAIIKAGFPGGISQYAKTNDRETFAEAFASFEHADASKQAELTRKIGAVLNRLFP